MNINSITAPKKNLIFPKAPKSPLLRDLFYKILEYIPDYELPVKRLVSRDWIWFVDYTLLKREFPLSSIGFAVGDQVDRFIMLYGKGWEVLDFTGVNTIGPSVLAQFSNVRSLNLRGQEEGVSLEQLRDKKKLTTLNLAGSDLDDSSVKQIAEISSLKSVNLALSEKFTGEGLQSLLKKRELIELDLGSCHGLTHEDLAATLPLMGHLESLSLANLKAVNDTLLSLIAEHIPGLKKLDLSLNTFSDVGLNSLKGLKHLCELNLELSSGMTQAKIDELKQENSSLQVVGEII